MSMWLSQAHVQEPQSRSRHVDREMAGPERQVVGRVGQGELRAVVATPVCRSTLDVTAPS